MTDADRIKRLEIAVERLCDYIQRNEPNEHDRSSLNVELEMIRQYVRGDMDRSRHDPPEHKTPLNQPTYWKDR